MLEDSSAFKSCTLHLWSFFGWCPRGWVGDLRRDETPRRGRELRARPAPPQAAAPQGERLRAPALPPPGMGRGCHGDEKAQGWRHPVARSRAAEQHHVSAGIPNLPRAPPPPPSRGGRGQEQSCKPALPQPRPPDAERAHRPLPHWARAVCSDSRCPLRRFPLNPAPCPAHLTAPPVPLSLQPFRSRGPVGRACPFSPFPSWKFLQARDSVSLTSHCEQKRQPNSSHPLPHHGCFPNPGPLHMPLSLPAMPASIYTQ